MLVLTRKPNQAIVIGDDIRIVLLSIEGSHVRLGIEAPRGLGIRRAESPELPADESDLAGLAGEGAS